MPAITRVGDSCSGHDACAPTTLTSGSSSVLVNGQPAGRVGDTYSPHGCEDHPSHSDSIASGSSTVFAEGSPVGRVGDSVSTSGTVTGGSPNVFAN